jgi:hypothetical protein
MASASAVTTNSQLRKRRISMARKKRGEGESMDGSTESRVEAKYPGLWPHLRELVELSATIRDKIDWIEGTYEGVQVGKAKTYPKPYPTQIKLPKVYPKGRPDAIYYGLQDGNSLVIKKERRNEWYSSLPASERAKVDAEIKAIGEKAAEKASKEAMEAAKKRILAARNRGKG